jgi:hypothetical protein
MPPVKVKIVPSSGHEYTLEKSTNESKGNMEQKFYAGIGTIF